MTYEEFERLLPEIIRTPDRWGEVSSDKLAQIDFPEISIHIAGTRYNSSVGLSLLKPITKLQKTIYEYYALAVYGDSSYHISEEEKKRLEIFIHIEKGSTNVLIEFVTSLIEAVRDMKDWQKFTAIVLAICVVGACHIHDTNTSKDIEISKAMASAEVDKELISLQKETLALQSDTLKITGELYQALSFVDGTVEINGTEMNRAELKLTAENKKTASKEIKEPQKSEYTKLVKGSFILSEITMNKEAGRNLPKAISFVNIDSGKEFKYIPDYESLSETASAFLVSCIKGETVELEMTATYDGNDNLKNVFILSWNGKNLSEPMLF